MFEQTIHYITQEIQLNLDYFQDEIETQQISSPWCWCLSDTECEESDSNISLHDLQTERHYKLLYDIILPLCRRLVINNLQPIRRRTVKSEFDYMWNYLLSSQALYSWTCECWSFTLSFIVKRLIPCNTSSSWTTPRRKSTRPIPATYIPHNHKTDMVH